MLLVLPPPGRQHFFVETDHEIFSTFILSLPLIQEGQLSISGELRGLSLSSKMWLGKLIALDMTPVGFTGP